MAAFSYRLAVPLLDEVGIVYYAYPGHLGTFDIVRTEINPPQLMNARTNSKPPNYNGSESSWAQSPTILIFRCYEA